MSEVGQPQLAPVAPEARGGTKAALFRVARRETVAMLGVSFLAVVCMLAYALDRTLTTPSRISSVLDMEVGYHGLVNDNLRFDAPRALLFFAPLAIVGITLGAGAFLVAVDSRKRVTPWSLVDRALVQSASASLLISGVGLGAVGAAVPVATPHWLVRAAIIVLSTTVIAAGLTTALRAPGRDPRLLVGGLAALVALSATAGVTDMTDISAGQAPLARSAWSDTGFWTAAPTGKPGAVTSYQAVACPTAQFCAALGTGLFGTLWSLSSDGGAKWEPAERAAQSVPLPGGPGARGVALMAGAPHGLSCWARSYCVASGSSPAQSTDGGKHWVHLRSKPGATVPSSTGGADCFAPGRCLLLGYAGGTGAATPVLVTHDAGGRWVKAQLPPGAWSLDSAFCTGPKSCIAVGPTGHVERAAVLASSDGGLSWQVRPAPLGALSLSEVTCPVPDRCVVLGPPSDGVQVIGAGWASGLVVYWTSDGGRSWARSTLLARLDTAQVAGAQVACSADTCVAVLSNTNMNLSLEPAPSVAPSFLLSRDYGRTWAVDRSPGSLGSVAANAEIQALTCNGTAVCAAVGNGADGGVIFYSHDGGQTWAAGHDLRGGPAWA